MAPPSVVSSVAGAGEEEDWRTSNFTSQVSVLVQVNKIIFL